MDKPNILLLFPDQHRGDWLPYDNEVLTELGMGELSLKMPNLRGLMDAGVTFTRHITSSPLCAPARACLASGLRYARCGVPDNGANYPLQQRTFYAVLRENGYRVGGVGKFDLNKPELTWDEEWHRKLEVLGFTDAVDSAGKWDAIRAYAQQGTPSDPYMKYLEQRGLATIHYQDMQKRRERFFCKPTPLPEDAYCDNWLGHNGLDMLDGFPAGGPWFLQVNFTGPHSPWDVTERMHRGCRDQDVPLPVQWPSGEGEEGIRRVRRNYAAMLENIDRNLGLFLEELEARGERERTIVIYSSDHGEMLGDFGQWSKRGPRRGSVRVPLVISGPGLDGRCTGALVELQDLVATILDFCGLQMPEAEDSRTLRPVLEGEANEHRDHQLAAVDDWRMIADRRYKLVEYSGCRDRTFELYDLLEDPFEERNVVGERPEIAGRLRSALPRKDASDDRGQLHKEGER